MDKGELMKTHYQYTMIKWWGEKLKDPHWQLQQKAKRQKEFQNKLRIYENTPFHILIRVLNVRNKGEEG